MKEVKPLATDDSDPSLFNEQTSQPNNGAIDPEKRIESDEADSETPQDAKKENQGSIGDYWVSTSDSRC